MANSSRGPQFLRLSILIGCLTFIHATAVFGQNRCSDIFESSTADQSSRAHTVLSRDQALSAYLKNDGRLEEEFDPAKGVVVWKNFERDGNLLKHLFSSDSRSNFFRPFAKPIGEANKRDFTGTESNAFEAYKSNAGIVMNSYLRTGKDGESGLRAYGYRRPDKVDFVVKDLTAHLASAFEKLPIYSGFTFRGTRLESGHPLLAIKAGDTFTEKGVLSSSTSFEEAHRFVGERLGVPVYYIIRSYSGRIVGVGAHAAWEQAEIAFKPDTKFKVIDKFATRGGWLFELEEVP